MPEALEQKQRYLPSASQSHFNQQSLNLFVAKWMKAERAWEVYPLADNQQMESTFGKRDVQLRKQIGHPFSHTAKCSMITA